MSELKWKWAYGPYLDPPEGQKESAIKAGYVKVVSKQSADEAIAELKSKLDEKDKEIARLDDLAHEHNIELLRKENLISELKEERRWRKVREELPTDEDAVAVCFHMEDGRLITSVDCFFDGEWQMMDDPEGYWMPLPKAPKEYK